MLFSLYVIIYSFLTIYLIIAIAFGKEKNAIFPHFPKKKCRENEKTSLHGKEAAYTVFIFMHPFIKISRATFSRRRVVGQVGTGSQS